MEVIMNTITKEQRIKAIEDSIKHWQEDIVKPLQDGRIIIFGFSWEDTGERVPYYGNSCALCVIYYDAYLDGCINCPLKSCNEEGDTWFQFVNNPCLKTAQAMVYELRAILIMEDRKYE